MKKNDIEQWRELCGKIKMLNHKCKDCRHGGGHADYPGNCPRHLPACLSFEPAACNKQPTVGRNAHIPLIDRCKSFVGKILYHLRKIGIVRCQDKVLCPIIIRYVKTLILGSLPKASVI